MRLVRWAERIATMIVVPILLVLIMVLAVISLPEAASLDRGEGVPGTYTAERVVHDRLTRGDTRTYYGTFVSDDEAVRLTDVPIDGDGAIDRVGDTVPAQYVADSMSGSGIHALDGSAVRDVWAIIVGAAAFLGGWAWRYVWVPRRTAR